MITTASVRGATEATPPVRTAMAGAPAPTSRASTAASIVRQLGGDPDRFLPLWKRAVTKAAPAAGDQHDFLARYRRNVAMYFSAVGSPYVTPDGGTERVDLAAAMADA